MLKSISAAGRRYLVLFLALLVAYILLLLLFFYETRLYAISQAEVQIEGVLLNYRAIRAYVRENQRQIA